MYKGEIKVQENELVEVLNTAQGLEIKGLSEKSNPPPPSNHISLPKSENIFGSHLSQENKRPPLDIIQPNQKRPKLAGNSELKDSSRSNLLASTSAATTESTFPTSVKQEITPVTIDIDDGDGVD